MFLPRSLSRKASKPPKQPPRPKKIDQTDAGRNGQDSKFNSPDNLVNLDKPRDNHDGSSLETECSPKPGSGSSKSSSDGPSGSLQGHPDSTDPREHFSAGLLETATDVHANSSHLHCSAEASQGSNGESTHSSNETRTCGDCGPTQALKSVNTQEVSEVAPGHSGVNVDNDNNDDHKLDSHSDSPAHGGASDDSTPRKTHKETEISLLGPDADEGDPVVSYSKSQRWPEEGEPVCVVCGRYGEYICDKTEADVCSLECKARNLARKRRDHRGEDMIPIKEEETAVTPEAAPVLSYSYSVCLEIARLSREEVQDIRAEFDIFVEGIDVPRPVLAFEQLFLPPKLLLNLKEVGYHTPTPVQMQVIPAALKCRDLMVCAQTSSGKTASFLIPSILHVLKYRQPSTPDQGPITLILTPTRELAQQIEGQAKSLMEGISDMRTALLVGGLPLPPQLHRLKQNIQLVIATPGRLLELIKEGELKMSSFKLLVIDEVDTMLRFGFQKQVEDIRGKLSDDHQTMLFSATIPAAIEKITELMLNDPVYVSIGTPSTPCSSVKQIFLWVEEPSKKKMLFNLLEDPRHYQPPVLVFVDSKVGADLLATAIEKVFGLDVGSIHSDKTQVERCSILQAFREDLLPILVSTGVLGRGLDLPKVKLVVNFDMPRSVEEYIHQIGRTGRLGSKGTAISFINNGNKKLFLELEKTLRPLGVPLPPELTNSQFLQLQKEEHQARKGKRRNQPHPGKSWKEFKKRKR